MKRIYAIRDVVAQAFVGILHQFPHDAPAVRLFSDVARDEQTIIGKHPEDYELWCLGELQDDGCIMPEVVVVLTGSAWKAAQAEGPKAVAS